MHAQRGVVLAAREAELALPHAGLHQPVPRLARVLYLASSRPSRGERSPSDAGRSTATESRGRAVSLLGDRTTGGRSASESRASSLGTSSTNTLASCGPLDVRAAESAAADTRHASCSLTRIALVPPRHRKRAPRLCPPSAEARRFETPARRFTTRGSAVVEPRAAAGRDPALGRLASAGVGGLRRSGPKLDPSVA